MLELFLSHIEKSLGAKATLIALSTFLVYLFFIKLPELKDSLNYSKYKRIAHMSEAVESDCVSKTHKDIFRREISSSYMFNTNGIKASEKELKRVSCLQRLLNEKYSVKQIYYTTKFFPKNKSVKKLTVDELKDIKKNIKKSRNTNFFSAFMLFTLALCLWLFATSPILSNYKFGNDIFSDIFIAIDFVLLYSGTTYYAIVFFIDGFKKNKNIDIVDDRISTIS